MSEFSTLFAFVFGLDGFASLSGMVGPEDNGGGLGGGIPGRGITP